MWDEDEHRMEEVGDMGLGRDDFYTKVNRGGRGDETSFSKGGRPITRV
jgi:hypothetical protein